MTRLCGHARSRTPVVGDRTLVQDPTLTPAPLPQGEGSRTRDRARKKQRLPGRNSDYQMITRLSGATNILSPCLMSKAWKKPGWLATVPMARYFEMECGSVLICWMAVFSRYFARQTVAKPV